MTRRKRATRKVGRVKKWTPEQLASNAAEFDALREVMVRKGFRVVDGDRCGVWCTIGARGFHIDTSKLIVDLSGVPYHLHSITEMSRFLAQCLREERETLEHGYRLDKAS